MPTYAPGPARPARAQPWSYPRPADRPAAWPVAGWTLLLGPLGAISAARRARRARRAGAGAARYWLVFLAVSTAQLAVAVAVPFPWAVR